MAQTSVAVPLCSMLLCGVFLASPLVGFSGREWGLHQWTPRLSLLLVCPAVPAASRLVPCVQLSTDLSGTQWWCKLLCGLWFLFIPGPGQCWGLPAFWWPCARGRSAPPKSLWPLPFTGCYWSQSAGLCPAWVPPLCLLQPLCQSTAQLQFVLVEDALLSLSDLSSSNRFILMVSVGVLTDTVPVPWSAACTFSCWFLKEPLMRWWISQSLHIFRIRMVTCNSNTG